MFVRFGGGGGVGGAYDLGGLTLNPKPYKVSKHPRRFATDDGGILPVCKEIGSAGTVPFF